MKIINTTRRRTAAGFNPLSDVPNIYGRWRAMDYDSGTGLILNSAGTAPADTTRNLQAITGGTYRNPDYNGADTDFNGMASIGSIDTSATTVGFRNQGNVNFASPITTAAITYGVYWVVAPPSPSTCYLQSSRAIGTGANSPSLLYFFSYQATRDGTNNVTAGTGQPIAALRIICCVYNTTSSAIYINSNTAAATGNTGTVATAINSLGVGNASGQRSLFRFAELSLYTGTHTTAQRLAMMQYLGRRYGVTIS